MITHARKIDMYPASVPVVVHLSQYDDDFTLEFTMFSSVGEFTVENGTTAKIRGTKKDGKGYSANATINTTQKKVTVTGNQQMTAIAGRNIYELVLTKNDKVLSTANFILDVEPAAMDANTVESESVIQEIGKSVNAYLDEHPEMIYQVDDTLSITGAAADAKKTGDEIADLKSDIGRIEPGLSDNAKSALLDCFMNVAWVNSNGKAFFNALYDALYAGIGLERIIAVFTQGTAEFYPSTPLNSLKAYLSITGYYADGTVKQELSYTLSGELTVGTSIVTVSCKGKTTTFSVTVSQPYWDYEWSADSKELPEGMTGTYHDFTTEDGTLYIENPGLDFGDEYTGDMRILIECKLYAYNKELEQESYRNLPQIVIANGNAKGCKLIGSYGSASNNPNFYVAFGINNVNSLVDGVKGMDSHVYDIKSENGVHTISVDGSAIPVTQNTGTSQWITKSCITSGNPESPLVYIMCIKHLAYKAL